MLILENFFDGFLIKNYVLLIMLGGLSILTVYDVYLEKKMLLRLRITLVLIFMLALFEYMEECYSSLPDPTNWRILFSAICYTLRPAIIMMIIFSVNLNVKPIIVIPAVINAMVAFSAFFTGIAFSFTATNNFRRGVLGYLPHVISAIYLIFLIYLNLKGIGRAIREHSLIMFIAIAAVGAAFLASIAHDEVVNPTYAACILLYYLFLYSQHTKRDTLTGLLNRQSFYSDTEHRTEDIKAVISIDLNELKWLNDNYGHAEGDHAIAVVSEAFMACVSVGDRVYRIGGDEFIILCDKDGEEYLTELVEKLRKRVDDTGYSCAFGMSFGKPVEDMIKEADQRMYDDKAAIKEQFRKEGRVLHVRSMKPDKN